MDQSRAINALAPFVALTKSANSPRAAADLITQATSAPNTYVFAELLQQPNIQSLAGNEQYGGFHTLLQIFSWGTWTDYKTTQNLPPLADSQALKLRLLSLLTLAARNSDTPSSSSILSYQSLCTHLELTSPVELEQLVTTALYSDLIKGTLNPSDQTINITSVAPLRDIAPGSVQNMVAELTAWSGRCDSVLKSLEAEIKKVKSESEKRAKAEAKAEKQYKAVADAPEKSNTGSAMGGSKTGHNTRGTNKREQTMDDDEWEDPMDVDSGPVGKKKSSGMMGKLRSGGGSR
ncbi:COP9 signalosome subunit 7 (CsnG) like protein [Zymoseptoria brevis]|uniref:COP9 signalosome subunit 7 (CsnG) like protein n=1 Tax=Zymoseptoria brevis TaxID=1047168 RepID=A0A0F4GZZ1_9PEZI|nr:COP9 signalosome subunit 7 (CsnG) like protein [Zymoseptoria brevis]